MSHDENSNPWHTAALQVKIAVDILRRLCDREHICIGLDVGYYLIKKVVKLSPVSTSYTSELENTTDEKLVLLKKRSRNF